MSQYEYQEGDRVFYLGGSGGPSDYGTVVRQDRYDGPKTRVHVRWDHGGGALWAHYENIKLIEAKTQPEPEVSLEQAIRHWVNEFGGLTIHKETMESDFDVMIETFKHDNREKLKSIDEAKKLLEENGYKVEKQK